MALKKYYVGIDLNGNEIAKSKFENLASDPVTFLTAGRVYYNTTTNKLKFYNGTTWSDVSTSIAGAMSYKGSVAFDDAQPSTPTTGDTWIFSSAGAVSWAGGAVVQIGDFTVYNGTTWDVFQGNVVDATTTVKGIVRLADATEVTNVSGSGVLTASNLASVASAKKIGSVDSVTTAALVADTELTTTFANFSAINSAQVFDPSTGEELIMQLKIVTNTVLLTSNVAFAGGVILKVVGQHVDLD